MVQHVKSTPFGKRQHARRNLVQRVLANLFAAPKAERVPDARIQQAQIVVDFRGRGHGGPRIAGRILLPDRDRRSDSSNLVHVRLFDALEELPRVRRKRFDVPPLPLGVDCVERETRLARAGNAGDHRDGVVRDCNVDILEIVDARPAHADFLGIRDRRNGIHARRCRVCWRQLLSAFRWHVPKQKSIRLCPPRDKRLERVAGKAQLEPSEESRCALGAYRSEAGVLLGSALAVRGWAMLLASAAVEVGA